jgi:TRAP-type uncharacterized transport system substrate-binding protein
VAMRRWAARLRRYWPGLMLGAVLALCVALGWALLAPTRLSVAVTRHDAAETGVIAAYARALAEHHKGIRLRLHTFDDYAATAAALERRAVDLALVRPDVSYPGNGLTAALMREETLIMVAPAQRKVDGLDKLGGRRLGMVTRDQADAAALEAILDYYGPAARDITVVRIRPEESEDLASRRLDALAFIAAPRTEEASRLISAASGALGGTIAAVPLEGLEPLTHRNPAFKEVTIATGALSLQPKLPAEEIKTAAITYRLVAADTLDRITVSKVVQHLFEMRPLIAKTHPAINLMKAPDNDAALAAPLPNHRGAADYFNREQQSFMDRWGDWLWFGLFGVGALLSGLTGLRQVFVSRRQHAVDDVLDRLLEILAEARAAMEVGRLDALAGEIDELVIRAVRHARWRTTSARTMSALIIALDSARAAILDRRRELIGGQAHLVPGDALAAEALANADAEGS